MSLFLTLITFIISFSTSNSATVSCAKPGPCTCTADDFCTLQCYGWQQCYSNGQNMILNCKPGHGCEVDCDMGDISCSNTIINANGATSLTVKCLQWKDCEGATVNCGNAASCSMICDARGITSICDNVNLNCGTSRCSIACTGDADDNTASCNNVNIDTTDLNIYSFECVSTEEFSKACNHAPPIILPPTESPSNDPTQEPTIPTLYPSQSPTIPTNNPSTSPSLPPTIHFEVISNITIEIEIDDPNITPDEITDLVDETTDAYLDRLFVDSDYQLTVDVIKTEGDILIVNIVVSTNGDIIELDEDEVINENKNQLEKQYGDKVRVKSDTSETLNEWYLYIIIGGVILLLVIAICILLYCVKKKKNNTKQIQNDKKIVEIGLTDTATHTNAIEAVTIGERDLDSNNNDEESDTAENLYTTQHVTKGMNDDDDDVIPQQSVQHSDSENDNIYGAGSVGTVGNNNNNNNNALTTNGNILDNDNQTDDEEDEEENSNDKLYEKGDVIRMKSESEI